MEILKKIGRVIIDNFGLLILSFVLAIILWLVVVNIDDPNISKNFTVPVTVENEESITKGGTFFEVNEDSKQVTFSVSGKRSYVEKLSNADFKAIADMEKMTTSSDGRSGSVPIEISALRYTSQLKISRIERRMNVTLDKLQKSQMIISPVITGEPAEGCVVGQLEVIPNTVEIRGPLTELQKINHVEARIDVTGMSSDISGNVIPTIVDAAGNALDTSKFVISVDSVTVSAQILGTKQVGIVSGYKGTPAEGYVFDTMSISPQTLTLQGNTAGLNQVTNITIPDSAVIIEGVSDTFTTDVDVREFLPEGVSVVGDDYTVKVTIGIVPLETKYISIPVTKIECDGLEDGMTLEYADNEVEIKLTGIRRILDTISESDLVIKLDVNRQGPGYHTGRLLVRSVGSVEVNSGVIAYTIKAINQTETDTDEITAEDEGVDTEDESIDDDASEELDITTEVDDYDN